MLELVRKVFCAQRAAAVARLSVFVEHFLEPIGDPGLGIHLGAVRPFLPLKGQKRRDVVGVGNEPELPFVFAIL